MKIKRLLHLTHRWTGIGMCLLVGMWFFTGVVMMYVSFPELTNEEYYAGLSNIEPGNITVGPETFLKKFTDKSSLGRLTLTTVATRPIYLTKHSDYSWQGMYADNGKPLENITATQAIESAQVFYQNQHPEKVYRAQYQAQIDMDQWSLSSALNSHRPLHLVSIKDRAHTQLYISSKTGQVVRDTTRAERMWNWVGSNLHWFYPLTLRKHGALWANTIIVLSLIGLLLIITGAIVGLQLLRLKRRYKNNEITPYRGVSKYHHILGLVMVVFLFTYMFSGLMSMNPWGLFDAKFRFDEQVQRYEQDGSLSQPKWSYNNVQEIQKLLAKSGETKQLTWHWIRGKSYLTGQSTPNNTTIYSRENTKKKFLSREIEFAVENLIPDAEIASNQQLNQYDAYYYSHHKRFHPLPILRVKFNDTESTWFHIDLKTGVVIERKTLKDRVQRWLYNGLHSLDFPILIQHRPLWDVIVISLCTIGLFFSITSIVIGWRRVKKQGRKKANKPIPSSRPSV